MTESTTETHEFPSTCSIRFIPDLSHHSINGLNLWIGVADGTLLVLDEEDDRLFRELRAGQPPASLAAAGDTGGVMERWNRITALARKCAEAGVLEGIPGFHEVCQLAPEKYVRVHLTARCQLECVHCYAASGPSASARGELTEERWRSILTDVAAAGGERVLFTGGEPLLRKDCTSLIHHAAACGMDVTLFTNGLLVERYVDGFAGAVSLAQVSLNGPDEASNDPIRGQGTFRKAMRAIEVLVEARVPVRIGMTVMERNWEAIRNGFPRFAAKFAGTDVRFHLGYGVCHFGRGRTLVDRLDLEEARPVLGKYLEAANGPAGRRITRRTLTCGYCEQLVIGPDGQVYPCHLLHGSLGHIDDRPIDTWHHVLRETAGRHLVHTIAGCAECDLRNLCGGTCRVINEHTTGSKWITTCTPEDRAARYGNLVDMFYQSTQRGGD